MNPTIASSSVFHERRFCVSLFISQVLAVLVCALLLYFTLNEPSPNRYADTDNILESRNSTDNDSDFEDTASGGAENKTVINSPKLGISEATQDGKDESECMFIQRDKLPHCDTNTGVGSPTSPTPKKGSYESPESLEESCNVLVQLTCNGTDFTPENDEDGFRAAVSCPGHHVGLADRESSSLPDLILRIEETNEFFYCSIVENSTLVSSNEAYCLSITKNANFCLGTFLSCACTDSHFSITATTTDMAHQSTTATPDVEPETDRPGQKKSRSALQLWPDDSLELNSYEYEYDI